MDCQKVRATLSEYLDQVLDKMEEEKIKAHLKTCTHCQEELAGLKFAINLIKNSEEVSPPAEFRSNLRQRLQTLQKEEELVTDETLPEEITTGKVVAIDKVRKLFKNKWVKIGGIAASILIFFALTGFPFGQSKDNIMLGLDSKAPNTKSKPMERGYTTKEKSTENRVEMYSMDNAQREESSEGGMGSMAIDGDTPQKSLDYGATERTTGEDATKELQRRVIKDGYLQLEVSSVSESIEEITGMVEGKGGFIQSSSYNATHQGYSSLVLRVPSEGYQALVDEVSALGKVKIKELTGQDVTDEYFDTEVRLNTLKTQEERLLNLLKKGDKLEDILRVEQELQRVREDIERQEGRLKALNDLVGLATLRVELYQNTLVPADNSALESPGMNSVLRGMINAAIDSSNNLLTLGANFIVFLGRIFPYVILLSLVGVIYYWLRRRYFNNKR